MNDGDGVFARLHGALASVGQLALIQLLFKVMFAVCAISLVQLVTVLHRTTLV